MGWPCRDLSCSQTRVLGWPILGRLAPMIEHARPPWWGHQITPPPGGAQSVPEAGVLDPRAAVAEADGALEGHERVVVGLGHFWHFVAVGVRARRPDTFIYAYHFGAIGNGLPVAIGAAVAAPDRPTILFEGDGSLLMSASELEPVARHQVPLLVLVMNDGAYGAEVHKLRTKGFDGSVAIFEGPDLAAIACGFGWEGVIADRPGVIEAAIRSFGDRPRPMLVDVRVSRDVLSDPYQRLRVT